RKIMECTCLRMQRATRLVTQLYDHALGPSGLTVSQFGLLAYLFGASRAQSNASSIGTIAEWLGMDPTTLNRNLKPLAPSRTRQGDDTNDGSLDRNLSASVPSKRLQVYIPTEENPQ